MTVKRTLVNTGNPLITPDGALYANKSVTFQLVKADTHRPISLFDAVNGDFVVGDVVTATTDDLGEFSQDLWPNTRGGEPTYYQVNTPEIAAKPFLIRVTEAEGPMLLIDAKAGVLPVPPEQTLTIFEGLLASISDLLAQATAVVTTTANGLMSFVDKVRLDALWTDETVVRTSDGLAAAVAAAGSSKRTIKVNVDQTLTGSLTSPANVEIVPQHGAVITHGGYSFSYAGTTRRWPLAQVLNGTGTVTLSEAKPEWFGVTGTADDVALQKALAAAPLVSMVPGKTYNASDTVTIPSNRTIEWNKATWKRATGSGVYDLFKNADQTTGNVNIVMRGLKLDGNKDADSLVATNAAHRFSGISFVKVSGISAVEDGSIVGTVNNETGGGIYLSYCTDVVVSGNSITGNDRSGIVAFNNTACKIIGNVCEENAGSGITGGSNIDCVWARNVTRNNGTNTGGTAYTGLNASGLRSRIIGNTSHDNTGSGITVGEATHSADDSVLTGNVCYSNGLDGLSIQNSARVRSIGDTFYGNTRNNIRVFISAAAAKFVALTSRDSAGGHGLLIESGKGHSVVSGDIYNNAISGIYAGTGTQINVSGGVRCYNNGQVTSANSCGVLLSGAVDSTIAAECFDDQGTPTQESGVWVAGGSGHIIGASATGNKTYQYRESSTPTNMRYVGLKTGNDPLQGTFTATAASTASTVANDNAREVSTVRVWPLNATAVGKIPYVSAVVVGVSFTVTLPSSAAGTEVYSYEIR